ALHDIYIYIITYFEINGKRYSHTIDPTTGCPIKHGLLSASVICKEAWKADALATAFMVMGVEKTQNFIKLHPEYEVFLIYSNNENSHPQDSNKGFQTWSSKGFKTFTSR
ncbi:MAG: FAD:protein FMN transferase, partial [Bacteroidales bacterium]